MSISHLPSPISISPDIQAIVVAQSSQERSELVRHWLDSQPSKESLQYLYRLLVDKDKGSARNIRLRLDELKNGDQYAMQVGEWLSSAGELLENNATSLGQLLAWQRDLAKTKLAVDQEPLQTTYQAIVQKIQQIEWIEQTAKILLEEEKLLCHRIEMLTLQNWQEAYSRGDELIVDISHWEERQSGLLAHSLLATLDARYVKWLQDARSHLNIVEKGLFNALEVAKAADSHPLAPLPEVIHWANQITKNRSDEKLRTTDNQLVDEVLEQIKLKVSELKRQLENGQSQQCLQIAQELNVLMTPKRLPKDLEVECKFLIEIAEKQDSWKKWSITEQGRRLISRVSSLYQADNAGPTAEAMNSAKIFEQLLEIKKEWKALYQTELMPITLIAKFERATKKVYDLIGPWLAQIRETEKRHEESRLRLIESLQQNLSQRDYQTIDWREYQDFLYKAYQQWNSAGHVHPVVYAKLDQQWKELYKKLEHPFQEVQRQSIERRKQWITKATELSLSPSTMAHSFKSLQSLWSQEARQVPLDAKREEQLWLKFRAPINQYFERLQSEKLAKQKAERERYLPIYQSLEELTAACKQENAEAIENAMLALDRVIMQPATDSLEQSVKPALAVNLPTISATPDELGTLPGQMEVVEAGALKEDAPARLVQKGSISPGTPATPALRLIARRGDDRPNHKMKEPVSTAKTKPSVYSRNKPKVTASPMRAFIPANKPLKILDMSADLKETYNHALVEAKKTLKELKQRVYGDLVQQIVDAWEQRNVELLPSLRDLGKQVNATMRSKWLDALSKVAHTEELGAWLLRLEVAADVPSPAEFVTQRRLLMLSNLSSKNKSPPSLTWAEDLAQVFLGTFNQRAGQRMVKILPALLKIPALGR
ncbi:MAG: hypothetical protein QM520_04385 [Gammaproteobacteria bacterium]|nr:hypothetical protein [Gammaproteobacteria bacterium]